MIIQSFHGRFFNHDKQFVHTNKERDEIIPIPDFRKIPPDFLSRHEKDISHLSELLLSKNVTQDIIDYVYNQSVGRRSM